MNNVFKLLDYAGHTDHQNRVAARLIHNALLDGDSELSRLVTGSVADHLRAMNLCTGGRTDITVKFAVPEGFKTFLETSYPHYNIKFADSESHSHSELAASYGLERAALYRMSFYSDTPHIDQHYQYPLKEVGGNISRIISEKRSAHSCNPILDAVDARRNGVHIYSQYLISDKTREEIEAMVIGPGQQCRNKAQDCGVTAPVLIWHHSAYDMSVLDMCDAMDSADALMGFAVMWFPPECVITGETRGVLTPYRLNWRKTKKVFKGFSYPRESIEFSTQDGATDYVHEWTCYISKFVVSQARSSRGTVYHFELMENVGGLQYMRIVLDPTGVVTPCTITKSIFVPKYVGKTRVSLRVKNPYVISLLPFTSKLKTEWRHFFVDTVTFSRALSTAMQQTEAKFTLQAVSSIVSCFSNRMAVDGKAWLKPEPLGDEELRMLGLAVYLLAYEKKYESGLTVQYNVKHIKTIRDKPGLLRRMFWSWKHKDYDTEHNQRAVVDEEGAIISSSAEARAYEKLYMGAIKRRAVSVDHFDGFVKFYQVVRRVPPVARRRLRGRFYRQDGVSAGDILNLAPDNVMDAHLEVMKEGESDESSDDSAGEDDGSSTRGSTFLSGSGDGRKSKKKDKTKGPRADAPPLDTFIRPAVATVRGQTTVTFGACVDQQVEEWKSIESSPKNIMVALGVSPGQFKDYLEKINKELSHDEVRKITTLNKHPDLQFMCRMLSEGFGLNLCVHTPKGLCRHYMAGDDEWYHLEIDAERLSLLGGEVDHYDCDITAETYKHECEKYLPSVVANFASTHAGAFCNNTNRLQYITEKISDLRPAFNHLLTFSKDPEFLTDAWEIARAVGVGHFYSALPSSNVVCGETSPYVNLGLDSRSYDRDFFAELRGGLLVIVDGRMSLRQFMTYFVGLSRDQGVTFAFLFDYHNFDKLAELDNHLFLTSLVGVGSTNLDMTKAEVLFLAHNPSYSITRRKTFKGLLNGVVKRMMPRWRALSMRAVLASQTTTLAYGSSFNVTTKASVYHSAPSKKFDLKTEVKRRARSLKRYDSVRRVLRSPVVRAMRRHNSVGAAPSEVTFLSLETGDKSTMVKEWVAQVKGCADAMILHPPVVSGTAAAASESWSELFGTAASKTIDSKVAKPEKKMHKSKRKWDQLGWTEGEEPQRQDPPRRREKPIRKNLNKSEKEEPPIEATLGSGSLPPTRPPRRFRSRSATGCSRPGVGSVLDVERAESEMTSYKPFYCESSDTESLDTHAQVSGSLSTISAGPVIDLRQRFANREFADCETPSRCVSDICQFNDFEVSCPGSPLSERECTYYSPFLAVTEDCAPCTVPDLVLRHARGDGNCLFDSIAMGLSMDYKRLKSVTLARARCIDPKDGLGQHEILAAENMEGDFNSILLIAATFGITVCVHGQVFRRVVAAGSTQTVHIEYHAFGESGHYNLLEPKGAMTGMGIGDDIRMIVSKMPKTTTVVEDTRIINWAASVNPDMTINLRSGKRLACRYLNDRECEFVLERGSRIRAALFEMLSRLPSQKILFHFLQRPSTSLIRGYLDHLKAWREGNSTHSFYLSGLAHEDIETLKAEYGTNPLPSNILEGAKYAIDSMDFDIINEDTVEAKLYNALREYCMYMEIEKDVQVREHQRVYKDMMAKIDTRMPIDRRSKYGILNLPGLTWFKMSSIRQGTVSMRPVGSDNHSYAFDGKTFIQIRATDDDDKRSFKTPSQPSRVLVSDYSQAMLSEKIAAHVRKMDFSDFVLPPIEFINGVPGAGKTRHIIENISVHKRKGSIVLFATKAGREDFVNRVATKIAGKHISDKKFYRTYASVCVNGSTLTGNELFCDEAMQVHAGQIVLCMAILRPTRVVMLGDRNQIPYDNRTTFQLRFHDLATIANVDKSLPLSYRCPQDVAYLWREEYRRIGSSFLSASSVSRSMSVQKYRTNDDLPHDAADTFFLTFTQGEKSDLQKSRKNVMTINEFQGNEREHIVLVRSSVKNNPLYEQESQMLVATTRHRKTFIYATINTEDVLSKKIAQLIATPDSSIHAHSMKGGYEPILPITDCVTYRDRDVFEKLDLPDDLGDNYFTSESVPDDPALQRKAVGGPIHMISRRYRIVILTSYDYRANGNIIKLMGLRKGQSVQTATTGHRVWLAPVTPKMGYRPSGHVVERVFNNILSYLEASTEVVLVGFSDRESDSVCFRRFDAICAQLNIVRVVHNQNLIDRSEWYAVAREALLINAYNGLIPSEPVAKDTARSRSGYLTECQYDIGDPLVFLASWFDTFRSEFAGVDQTWDSEMVEHCDLDLHIDDVVIDLSKAPVFPSPYSKLTPVLITNQPILRSRTQRESLLGFEKRNAMAFDTSITVDFDRVVTLVTQKFLNVYCDRERLGALHHFRRSPVEPNVEDLVDWIHKQQLGSNLERIIPEDAWETTVYNEFEFQIKRQPKTDPDLNLHHTYPAVQTITASDKSLIALLSPVISRLKQRLLYILQPRVLLNCDLSHEELEDEITRRLPRWKMGRIQQFPMKYYEIDLSKYDKSQRKLHLEIELTILVLLGCPRELALLIANINDIKIVVERGTVVPDPLKLLVKLGRYDLANYDHVEEYRTSLLDLTSNYDKLEVCLLVGEGLRERYDIQSADCSALISALHTVISNKATFASLWYVRPGDVLCLDPSVTRFG